LKTQRSKTGIAVLAAGLFVTADVTYQLVQHDNPIALIVAVAMSILSNSLWMAARFTKSAEQAASPTAGA
jgi:hypothetical protein